MTNFELDPKKHKDLLDLARTAESAIAYGEKIVARQNTLLHREIEPDALPWAIRELMQSRPDGWHGPAKDLIKAVRKKLPRRARRHQSVPTDPQAMAARLNEIAPLLGAAGIDVVRSMPRDVRIYWLLWEG